jgi:hypothetical protein
MLVVDGDKIDQAVLREVSLMAKNAGMYVHSLDEIFVPSCCHQTVTIDNSIQCALVRRGVLTGFSAAGSGGSQVIQQRAATLGILLNGFVLGLLQNASILAELGDHFTVFIEASKCLDSGGDLSTPRGTGAYVSSGRSSCSTHRFREPHTIAPSSKKASGSSTGPAVLRGRSHSSSSIHQPREPGLPASYSVDPPRHLELVRRLGPKKEDWDGLRLLQDFHTMCMTLLREKKERLQFLEVKNMELTALLHEQSQKKKTKYHR